MGRARRPATALITAVLITGITIAATPAHAQLSFDPTTYPLTSVGPSEPRLVDADGTNGPEILTASGRNGRLHVLPNQGAGTYGGATDVAGCNGGTAAYNLVTGDWNGDSKTDAVINCYGQIASLRGNGSGFETVTHHALTGGTDVMTAGNGGSGPPVLFYTGQMSGNGRGSPLCTASFDGSATNWLGCYHQPDLSSYPVIGGTIVTANIQGGAEHEVVSLGGPNQQSVQLFEYPVWSVSSRASGFTDPSRVGAVLLDDVDTDGDVDMVLGDKVGDHYSTLLWQGPGGTAATGWPAGTPGTVHNTVVQNTSIGAGDFDRDGKRDLAIANFESVAVHLGNGDGTFGPAQQYTLDGDGFDRYSRLTIGDVNGDAKPDIVISVTSFGGSNDKVIVMRNTAGGAAPDTTPPETSIGALSPSGAIPQPSAALYFESSEDGSSYECMLERAGGPTIPFERCASPKLYENLANGDYTFSVKATDVAGNTDPSPAVRQFTVDVPPPPPPPPPPLPGAAGATDSRPPDHSPSSGGVIPLPPTLSVPTGSSTIPTGSASNPPTSGTTQTVTTGGGTGPKAAKLVVIARGKTTIPAGTTKKLTAKLTSAGKKLLKKKKTLKVTVTVVARRTDGTISTVKRTVKLKLKRR